MFNRYICFQSKIHLADFSCLAPLLQAGSEISEIIFIQNFTCWVILLKLAMFRTKGNQLS